MSDVMLFGVLRMPYDMAMSSELSRYQYWGRGQQAADEIERLRETVRTSTQQVRELLEENANLKMARAEPVAWDIYLPDVQHGYITDDLDDIGVVDDLTNNENAVVTPLYTSPAITARTLDKGPWEVADNGRTLYSDDFDHDVTIKISGDFADDEQRIGYAKAIAFVLNAASMDLAHELMGIAADVDAGNGFDPVCRRTLQRVIDALLAAAPKHGEKGGVK